MQLGRMTWLFAFSAALYRWRPGTAEPRCGSILRVEAARARGIFVAGRRDVRHRERVWRGAHRRTQ
jgi:hypothetical protein